MVTINILSMNYIITCFEILLSYLEAVLAKIDQGTENMADSSETLGNKVVLNFKELPISPQTLVSHKKI